MKGRASHETVAGPDGGLDRLDLGSRGLSQIAVQDVGRNRPAERRRCVVLAELARNAKGIRDEPLERERLDVRGEVGEPEVEVCLVNEMDTHHQIGETVAPAANAASFSA